MKRLTTPVRQEIERVRGSTPAPLFPLTASAPCAPPNPIRGCSWQRACMGTPGVMLGEAIGTGIVAGMEAGSKGLEVKAPPLPCISTASCGENTAFALYFHCPSWRRHCLWCGFHRPSLAKTLPLPCGL